MNRRAKRGEAGARGAAGAEKATISRDVHREFRQSLSFGDRLSDRIAAFGGSWGFIISFALALMLWIFINSVALVRKPFDPYPFILLNLVLSCLAAIQAPIIMMSQNRQEAKDRLRSQHDFEINLKAERELQALSEGLRTLLDRVESLERHLIERGE